MPTGETGQKGSSWDFSCLPTLRQNASRQCIPKGASEGAGGREERGTGERWSCRVTTCSVWGLCGVFFVSFFLFFTVYFFHHRFTYKGDKRSLTQCSCTREASMFGQWVPVFPSPLSSDRQFASRIVLTGALPSSLRC